MQSVTTLNITQTTSATNSDSGQTYFWQKYLSIYSVIPTYIHIMKATTQSFLLAFCILCCLPFAHGQITGISVETFYEDDGSVPGYPVGHKTFRVYANVTNSTDRVNGISGVDENPLVIQISGNGAWNSTFGGVSGDALNCGIVGISPAAFYDSYITIGVQCDSDGSAFTTYTAEDPGASWLAQMFNTADYGSIQDVTVNTPVGAGWFVIPSNPASLPDLENRVLLAQITTNGNICGVFNAQVFPQYAGPGSPYILQNGLTFGDLDDSDGDGFSGCEADCNDNDVSIYPGATESCNGLDDDCDGQIDEGTLTLYYRDFDGDGFGNINVTQLSCSQPFGFVTNNTDCDDISDFVYPGAAEVCNLLDDNCDLTIDEGLTYNTYYLDMDGDGYGDNNNAVLLCEPNDNVVEDNTDCNDSNAGSYPGAEEVCNSVDDDCDGSTDEGFAQNTYYGDSDGDGFGNPNESILACEPNEDYVEDNTDCDDSNSDINTSAIEVCDTQDNNCDGLIDEGVEPVLYYFDGDEDGYGDDEVGLFCVQPEFTSTLGGDCNDNEPSINPAASEVCNGLDDNCNLTADENLPLFIYYADADGDGFGNINEPAVACEQPAGYLNNNEDCNDSDANMNPNATELCNDIDDNCNGQTDETLPVFTYYLDSDDDGFGDPESETQDCAQPAGYVADNTDCDDSSASVNPDAIEQCNNQDDNCNELIDDNVVDQEYFSDDDNDGFGDESLGLFCLAPANSSLNDGDCNDNNAGINPDATEVCNNIDDDCDEEIDEQLGNVYYEDNDNDGFGNTETTIILCEPMIGYSDVAGDCDDNNDQIYPDASEVCNDLDDNCDGNVDEFLGNLFYADIDADGFGDPENSTVSCLQLSGFVANSDDCNDNNSAINPAATETCDNIDEDCDGVIDNDVINVEYYSDADGDGFGSVLLGEFCSPPANASLNNTDCDDTNNLINPNASEICNNTDDNCDGIADEFLGTLFYADSDDDGFGDLNETIIDCDAPSGYVDNDDDCDDNDAAVNPDATEIPGNNVDEDCDGQIVASVSDFSYQWQVQLYPNPVVQNLNLAITGISGIIDITICDLLGAEVWTGTAVSGNGPVGIDCHQMAQGTYIATIRHNDQKHHIGFVKLQT